MKATDFNLRESLVLDPDTGIATFRNNRLVVLDASALGLLRNMLIQEVGPERARALFLRFGFSNGYNDFNQMKKKHSFDTEMDLLASGPVIHTWEGIVKATPTAIRFDRAAGQFFFTGCWSNSWEAEQHLSFLGVSDEPTCWTLMGYASGWCSSFFGAPVIAIEPTCVGKGDETCGWEIKPPADWDAKAEPYVAALSSLFEAA